MGDRSGAVVVMNYKTGEILASVSTPGFDPKTIKEPSEDDAGSQLVNRATMGRYTPGSVFKLVTAAAVLEYKPELASKTYTCTGEVDYGEDGRVTCSGGAVTENWISMGLLRNPVTVFLHRLPKTLVGTI